MDHPARSRRHHQICLHGRGTAGMAKELGEETQHGERNRLQGAGTCRSAIPSDQRGGSKQRNATDRKERPTFLMNQASRVTVSSFGCGIHHPWTAHAPRCCRRNCPTCRTARPIGRLSIPSSITKVIAGKKALSGKSTRLMPTTRQTTPFGPTHMPPPAKRARVLYRIRLTIRMEERITRPAATPATSCPFHARCENSTKLASRFPLAVVLKPIK